MEIAPVLLIVFNRPEKTVMVLDQIREAKVTNLYVSADGPRNETDKIKCEKVRAIVKEKIDWNCEVHYQFHDRNQGCKVGVINAIDWFFGNEAYGMILEDDCVPSFSFFSFCTEMLRRYQSDQKVYHVSGSNKQKGQVWGDASYYFSYFPSIWGWATWADRWSQYDSELRSFDSQEMTRYSHFLKTENQQFFYNKTWSEMKAGKVDTWDHQWTHLVLFNQGLAIVPNVNLVTNVGFDCEATHTTHYEPDRANQESMDFKGSLIHPNEVKVESGADDVIRMYIEKNGLYKKTKGSLKQKIKDVILKIGLPKSVTRLIFNS